MPHGQDDCVGTQGSFPGHMHHPAARRMSSDMPDLIKEQGQFRGLTRLGGGAQQGFADVLPIPEARQEISGLHNPVTARSPLNKIVRAIGPGAHASGRYIQQVSRILSAVGHPFADRSPSFDQDHLDCQPVLAGTPQGLGRGHGAAESPADNDDGRHVLRVPSLIEMDGLRSRPKLPDVPKGRCIHMHGYQQLPGRGRIANGMDPGVLPGQDLATRQDVVSYSRST